MKLPRIKLTPNARVKAKRESASTPDADEKPAALATQTTLSTPPRQASPLPTSRWNIHEPMPVLSHLLKQPLKHSPRLRTVRFELFAPEAHAVFLAGSFNDWSSTATPMNHAGEAKWIKELLLPPGLYQYRFVVDGEWMEDPKANDYVPNPFGGCNSVVHVE